MTDQNISEDSVIDGEGNLILRGEDRIISAESVARLRSEFPGVLEELQLHREAYGAWKASGSAAHAALLEIWHMAEREDTSHMTYGDDTESVVEAVRTELRRHREELREKEVETFELIIDASEELNAELLLDGDSRNTEVGWAAGYRDSMGDLAEYLRQKVAALRSPDQG